MSSEILAVTFDAGGTLIQPWPSVGAIYAQVAAAHGSPSLCPEELTRRFAAGWRRRPEFSFRRSEWMELVDETFAGLTPVPPSRTFFPQLYERFDAADAWWVYNDVEPTLAALHARGLRLAVISNWDERLPALLRKLGLLRWFDMTTVSLLAGYRKPDSRIFAQTAASLGVKPGNILHVGDDERADVAGARAAGFQAVHLLRPPYHRTPDCIQDLHELPARLHPAQAATRSTSAGQSPTLPP